MNKNDTNSHKKHTHAHTNTTNKFHSRTNEKYETLSASSVCTVCFTKYQTKDNFRNREFLTRKNLKQRKNNDFSFPCVFSFSTPSKRKKSDLNAKCK